MKISYNWLKDYIKTNLEAEKVAEILTNTGLEVEGIEKMGGGNDNLEGVVVGKVVTLEKHPNADKLQIAMVDIGKEENLQIICGAPNIEIEQKVPVATVGTTLPGENKEVFKIKKAKLRGVESYGMICSESELGISKNNEGIWVLEPSHKVGTPINEFIKNSEEDVQYEIGLTPNRTDAMSHFGVARDLNAALKIKKFQEEFSTIDLQEFEAIASKGECPVKIEVQNPELAPRYAGLFFENLTIKPSPQWIQDRLKAIGLNPINNVVDITNYILHDLGQALHAFDADKIYDGKILVKKADIKEKFITLDGVERELNGNELMIADQKGGLCMAGIYGGIDSGVTEATKSIFLESAYFDPVTIRKAAKHHGLNTDASFRFERGADPDMVIPALKKAAILLVKYADATVKGEIQDIYSQPIENHKTVLRYHKIDSLVGERLHRELIKEILGLLDISVLSETNETLELSVPPYRADVTREVDVIEEILRIYGYNKIKSPEKVSFSIVPNTERNTVKIENAAAAYLISQGFYEAMNNSVGATGNIDLYGGKKNEEINLLNPLSSDLMTMRQFLLPGLLQNTTFNIHHKQKNIKLFEFGKTYRKTESKFAETYRLGILVSGNKTDENWTIPNNGTSFFYLKGIVTGLLNRLGISGITESPGESKRYDNCIRLKAGNKELGILGEVHKEILKKEDTEQNTYAAELDWGQILELSQNAGAHYKKVSKFPAVKRDLALLIDKEISYSELVESVKKLKIKLLQSVQLFDVYEGDKLPDGKKSYAMSFILQDENKTLEDKEIDKIMQKLIHNFKEKFKAELRD